MHVLSAPYVPITVSFSKLAMSLYVQQAVAGLAADGRQVVARAKSEATNYERLVMICAYSVSYEIIYPHVAY